jgi:hypothetical protein
LHIAIHNAPFSVCRPFLSAVIAQPISATSGHAVALRRCPWYNGVGLITAQEDRHMQNTKCPTCGGEIAADAPCPSCGHAAVNGVAKPHWIKPPPPPELADLVITPVPPEMAEEFRRTFNEEEWQASVREMEQNGSYRLEDFIDEIEQIANGNE